MLQNQKETILSLVKDDYANKNYTKNYLVSYNEFLDIEDSFTDFNCERGEGKAQYVSLIEQLICKDEDTEVFVEVYGFEEDGEDAWIYADTLLVFSQLPLRDIEQIFNASNDIFPSEIGQINDLEERYFIIKEGTQHSANMFCDKTMNVYFCWWD